MKKVISGLRKQLYYKTALSAMLINVLNTGTSFAAENDLIADNEDVDKNLSSAKEGYTINFNNVSVIEYIRFVSKISNLNFVFDEQDLQFNVTIVSEEPISVKNIMSALVQILRIHDLSLLEQENNILITHSKTVNQISTIVSADVNEERNGPTPIVTRVFRIKNANPTSIASIIRPMMSDSALIEISAETRQLIVTDITTNVEKIASLLASLDAPHTPLEIESYVAKRVSPQELISLTQQLVSPFAEGNPLIFVPQPETNTIFIVSTPYLIEKAMTVMEDLDVPPKGVLSGQINENIFVYKIQNKPAPDLQSALTQIADELAESPAPPAKLIETLRGVRWIKESNSLLFMGDTETLNRVKEILSNIDASGALGRSTFYIYRIQHANEEQIAESLKQIADNLESSNIPDRGLVSAIQSMRWIKETNTLIFTGDETSLKRLAELLPTFDVAPGTSQTALSQLPSTNQFFIYNPKNRTGDELVTAIEEVSRSLKDSGLADPAFLHALDSMKWVPANNALVFTGDAQSIERIKGMISSIDVPGTTGFGGGPATFFLYKLQYAPAEYVLNQLKNFAKNLPNNPINSIISNAIDNVKAIKESNALLLSGPSTVVDKIKEIIAQFDTSNSAGLPEIQHIGQMTFLIYKLQYVSATQLMSSLRAVATDLQASGSLDKDLGHAIDTMRWVKETNSILFTGSTETLEKIEAMIAKFDNASFAGTPIEAMRGGTFILYTPQYQTGEELINILCDFEQNLISAGVSDKGLFDTINSLQWIDRTSSLLISGDKESIAKVQDLLTRFDVPSKESGLPPSIESIENTSFLIYKLQYHPGDEIKNALRQIAADLHSKGSTTNTNQNLLNAINSLQWIKMTNSLLSTGEQDVLAKLRDLIQNLDVPLRQVFIEVLVIETTLANTLNFGLSWGGKVQYMNKAAASTGNFPVSPNPITGAIPPNIGPILSPISGSNFPVANNIPFSSGFDLGVIGDIVLHKGRSFISLGSLVDALQVDQDATIVMNPKIVAQDNNNSTIFIGKNIPFVGSLITTQGLTNSTATSLEYRDVGVNLSITPMLGNGDVVTMDITNDISEVINQTAISNTQVSGITTSHTTMNTRVHVPNKHFVVLSGMITDTKSRFRSGLPCLGGLPVIGAAFSENDRTNAKDNLVIFVRPHIINSFDEYKEITENQENVYKDANSKKILKEEFDAAIDIVKTADNE